MSMRKSIVFFLLSVLANGGCKTTQSSGAKSAYPSSSDSDGDSKGQINSTILLLSRDDYGLKDGTSTCIQLVDRAMTSGTHKNKLLNFVPTHFFRAGAPFMGNTEVASQCPKVMSDCAAIANGYCHRDDGVCSTFNEASLTAYRDGMAACFKEAVTLGADINVTPHLDDGGTTGMWRNNVRIEPYPAGSDNCVGNFSSYYCVILKPLADALNVAIRPGTKVFFATQGEMGATVFAYPDQYLKVFPLLRAAITQGRTGIADSDIMIGLSVNHENIFGRVDPASINTQTLTNLFTAASFIGVSGYIRSDLTPKPAMFDNIYDAFNAELQETGLSLRSFPQLSLIFSEIGIGGHDSNNKKATTAAGCAEAPWEGTGDAYSTAVDPWQSSDCNKLRRNFYCAAVQYMAGQTSTKWKVDHAFIWNSGSWDVQMIANGSYSGYAGYGDKVVIDMLRNYNTTGQSDCTID